MIASAITLSSKEVKNVTFYCLCHDGKLIDVEQKRPFVSALRAAYLEEMNHWLADGLGKAAKLKKQELGH